MAKLFLDGIFSNNSDSPSSVRIILEGSTEKVNLTGLLTSDPSFSAQNKWGPVINDVANLQDLASLIGMNYQSWVHASTMCWKGTSPLILGVDFYLINYKRGLNIEPQLKELVKLASLAVTGPSGVEVHGGYRPDVTSSNTQNQMFNGAINPASWNSISGTLQSTGFSQKSTITLYFGHKSIIRNLLINKIDVTESIIEVTDKNGGNKKPLYYRVSAQFTGTKPLLTTDVDGMFSFT